MRVTEPCTKWYEAETRRGARIQQGEHYHQTRAADLKSGGPRYPSKRATSLA